MMTKAVAAVRLELVISQNDTVPCADSGERPLSLAAPAAANAADPLPLYERSTHRILEGLLHQLPAHLLRKVAHEDTLGLIRFRELQLVRSCAQLDARVCWASKG